MAAAASYQVPCSQIDGPSFLSSEGAVERDPRQDRAFAVYSVARSAQIQRLSFKKIFVSAHPALIDRMKTMGAIERK